MSSNDFSPLAESALDRIRQIVDETVDRGLGAELQARFLEELQFHCATLEQAFEHRKKFGPARSPADSDVYFREKLGGLRAFAKMAIMPSERENYSAAKIAENVTHYAYLTSNLVAADLRPRTRRPSTERAVDRSAYEHQDALERLVNR